MKIVVRVTTNIELERVAYLAPSIGKNIPKRSPKENMVDRKMEGRSMTKINHYIVMLGFRESNE